ncbi:MAG: hypothetical protein ABSF44_09645 [Candidatus Bathyarchaeia archaeon]|jgi:hypothetical protein
MPDQFEDALLKIIKTFSPKEREQLKPKGKYWFVLKTIDHFGTRKFSLKSLAKCTQNQETAEKPKADELAIILDKLVASQLAIKDKNGSYRIHQISAEALEEAFGFVWKPRAGKTNFVKYLSCRKQRVMIWYSLYQGHQINAEEAHEVSGYPTKTIEKLLVTLQKENLVKKIVHGPKESYNVQDEKKLFQKLLVEYSSARVDLEPIIIELMHRYDRFSGAQIRRDLEYMGYYRDKSYIYKQFRKLEKKKIIRNTGITEKVRGGSYNEYYKFTYEVLTDFKEQVKSAILETINKSDLKDSIQKEFFDRITQIEPHLMWLFLTDLQYIVYHYKDQINSLPIWEQLIKNLPKEKVERINKEFTSTSSKEEFGKRLTRISRELKLSPFIVSMIYLTCDGNSVHQHTIN